MSDMEALDGPLKGKIYFGVPLHTTTIVDYYRTPYDFYCVTYERTDKGWKFIKEVAANLNMDYSNCEHDDVWFSRDICSSCNGMHYYCEDCGVMVDDHFDIDELDSDEEVSDTLMSLHKEMIEYFNINNGDNAFTANVIIKAYLLGLKVGRNESLE